MTDKKPLTYTYFCRVCHGIHDWGTGCEFKVKEIDKNVKAIKKLLHDDTGDKGGRT